MLGLGLFPVIDPVGTFWGTANGVGVGAGVTPPGPGVKPGPKVGEAVGMSGHTGIWQHGSLGSRVRVHLLSRLLYFGHLW